MYLYLNVFTNILSDINHQTQDMKSLGTNADYHHEKERMKRHRNTRNETKANKTEFPSQNRESHGVIEKYMITGFANKTHSYNKKNKMNVIPPLSIKLRRKVNVMARNCEEVEILRRVKNNPLIDGKNNSIYFMCIKLKDSSDLENHHRNRTFEICYCESNNTNCVRYSVKKSTTDVNEGSIMKREMALESRKQKLQYNSLGNDLNPCKTIFVYILICVSVKHLLIKTI